MHYKIVYGEPEYVTTSMTQMGQSWKPLFMSSSDGRVYVLMSLDPKDVPQS